MLFNGVINVINLRSVESGNVENKYPPQKKKKKKKNKIKKLELEIELHVFYIDNISSMSLC